MTTEVTNPYEPKKLRKNSTDQLRRKMAALTNIPFDSLAIDRERLIDLLADFGAGLYTVEDLTEELQPVEPESELEDEHTPLDEAIETAARTRAVHDTVRFELKHHGGGVFSFVGSREPFRLHKSGAGYIGYRLAEFDPGIMDYFRAGDWDGFAEKVNEGRWAQEESTRRAGSREFFVTAVRNGELMGMLTTYKPVANVDVLNEIKRADLAHLVRFVHFTPYTMRAYLTSRFTDEIGWALFRIVVVNGETGHQALSYTFSFTLDGYEFDLPKFDRSRHLGQRISEVVGSLSTLYEEAIGVEIDLWMQSHSYRQGIEHLREKFGPLEKLDEIEGGSGSLTSLVARIAHLRQNERGWKGVGKVLLDEVFTWAYEGATSK